MARKRRRADRYVTLRVDHETPLAPDLVRMMLDKIPENADIVEMRVGDIDALFASRHVDIFYTTSMPWEAK